MKEFIFTFGQAHYSGEISLKNRFVSILANNTEEARELMNAQRGNVWAFCYDGREKAGVDRWKLKEIRLEELQPQTIPEFKFDD